MAVAQLQILRLTHRHRGQAPSHICSVVSFKWRSPKGSPIQARKPVQSRQRTCLHKQHSILTSVRSTPTCVGASPSHIGIIARLMFRPGRIQPAGLLTPSNPALLPHAPPPAPPPVPAGTAAHPRSSTGYRVCRSGESPGSPSQ